MKLVSKVKGMVSDVKQHWNTPKPGRLVPYKEVAAYGFGGMGIYWATILSSQIGLSANNFLVGHAINLKPVDLQIMLNIANLTDQQKKIIHLILEEFSRPTNSSPSLYNKNKLTIDKRTNV